MSKSRDFFNNLTSFAPSSTERAFIQVVEGPKGQQGDAGLDGIAIYYGPTAPTSGIYDGLVWIKTDSGKSYVYVSTESGSQFVDIFAPGVSITSDYNFDFPTGPATGSNYTFNDRTWQWSGQAWDFVSSNITIGLTAPNAVYGNFWYDMSGPALLVGIKDVDGNDIFVEV